MSVIGKRSLLLGLIALFACGGELTSPTSPSGPQPATIAARSFQLINEERVRQDVEPALILSDELSLLARLHSEAMRDEGFFDHTDPSGQSVDGRLEDAGIEFRRAGENIARVTNAGADPAAFAHDLLMSQVAHRNNILEKGFTKVGVGVARRGDTHWITQVFVGN